MRSSRHEKATWRGPARPGPGRRVLPGSALGIALLLLAPAVIAAPQDPEPEPEPTGPGFRVVVHADNSVSRLPAKTVASMFLNKSKRWETGEMVVPIDLEPRHPVRKVFTRAVHNKSITAIQSFWQRIIFSGRGSPPATKATEEEILAFVAETPGAIGYVSDAAELGDGVRVLRVDDLKETNE